MTYCSPSVAKMKKSSPPPPSYPSSTKVTSRPPSVCGSIKRVTSGRHCKCCTEAIGRRYSGYKAQELIHLVLESKHSTRAEVLFTSTFYFYRRFNFLYLTFFSSFYYFCTCPEDSAPVPGVALPSSAGELPRESRAGIWGNYCCFVLAHLNLLGIHERRFIGQLRLAVSRNLKRQTGTRLHLFLSQGLHFGEVRSMAPPDCFNQVAVILCFLSLKLGESFMFTYTIYLRVKEQTF